MAIQPKIIFIAAQSRSGSTLMDRILGQEADFFSMGEIRHIWRRSIIEDQLCGCGKIFSKCSFWDEVIRDAFGKLDDVDAMRFEGIFRKIHSIAKTPQICWKSFQSDSYKYFLEEWGSIIRALYQSISKISGAKYLIDSSKTPTYGLLLSHVLKTDNLFVIYLLRDPRAVAFSRIRKRKRPEIHWEKQYMGFTPPYKTAMQWISCNIICELLTTKSNSIRIRYEDMVVNPEPTADKILHKIKGKKSSVIFTNSNKVFLEKGHTSSGNPMRFKVGEIEIRPDMEWKEALPPKDWVRVSYLCFPLLLRYSYNCARIR